LKSNHPDGVTSPVAQHKEEAMQWITVGAPPFRIEQYDQVFAQLDEQPAGLQTRYVGTDDDGKVRIVAVWESKEQADRFFAEMRGPLLVQALGSEAVDSPDVIGIEVAHSYVREPVS
jgi:hypothetical protein